MIVGNRDRCGRCHTKHGGNSHLCQVHGPVSEGCCPRPGCNPEEWVWYEGVGTIRATDPTPEGEWVERPGGSFRGYWRARTAAPMEALNLRIPAGDKERLQAIAQGLGIVSPSGGAQGQPSISRLLAAVASGELVVSRTTSDQHQR